jgi:hypothetical protein
MPLRFGMRRKTSSSCWTKGGRPTHFIYATHANNPTLEELSSVLTRKKKNCPRTTDCVLRAHPTHKLSADTRTNIVYFTFGSVAIAAPRQTIFAPVQFTSVTTVTIETASESEVISHQVLMACLRWNQSHVQAQHARTSNHPTNGRTRIIIMSMDPRRCVNAFINASCAILLLFKLCKRILDRETLFTIPTASKAIGGGVSLAGRGLWKRQISHSVPLFEQTL